MMCGFTYAVPIFDKHVVITTNGDQEKNDLHVIKHMNPLFALRTLTTNINHLVCKVT